MVEKSIAGDSKNSEIRVHQPVLLQESLDFLDCSQTGFYVDCTVGMGGHAEEILRRSSPDGFLLAIDKDPEAISYAQKRLAPFQGRFQLVQGDYKMIGSILDQTKRGQPDGILVDMGTSMLQLTSADRGFSFQREGPLDMRMDPTQGETAADFINRASLEELIGILRQYGEEPQAARIAREIVRQRTITPIRTTTQLREIVEKVVPRRKDQRIHPATRTFQALRITVNKELQGLDDFLFDAFNYLKRNGRLVIIAFHSLEDRLVKQFFQFLTAPCRCPKTVAVCQCGGQSLAQLLTRKPVTPREEEVARNPAARSARLRAIRKLLHPAPRHLWQSWLSQHS